MPFFSVVIPLYNKENYIKQTLESVLSQTFQDFEIVVVDDGSTDNGVEVVKSLSDDRIILHQQLNKGASSARNYGVEVSSSPWVALLDADDIWYKDHLFQFQQTIKTLPKAEVISNAYEIQLSSTYIKLPVYSCTLDSQISYVQDYFSCSLIDSLFWTSSIAFKKNVFLEVGGFDTSLKTGQDLDLFIRFALKYKLAYNPKITLLYKSFTENNLSKAVTLAEKHKYIKKHKVSALKNHSLKAYLDINRFSLAIQAKQKKDMQLYAQVEGEIDDQNLNSKQKLLLKFPGWALRSMKKLQLVLIRLGIYRTAF
jgi:glycosyltransferase involved in cell wall biosynthesis